MKIIKYIPLYFRARRAYKYAVESHLIGIKFADFAHKIGIHLILKGIKAGVRLMLVPVSSTRYFEFSFVEDCIKDKTGTFLDISSPNLFGFWLAKNKPDIKLIMSNPDKEDIGETQKIIKKLNINNIYTEISAIDTLRNKQNFYDCIWSISVIEHVYGSYDDIEAMKIMYQALKPGGKLIITVPVDKKYWVEYRSSVPDGPMAVKTENGYFTQRFYDLIAINDRLISPIGKNPIVMRWWGEKSNGRFLNYCDKWIKQGYSCTVDDPIEFLDNYREYESWNDMPGIGVVGLMFEK